jgi:glyoxylase-like metal-dependent hydrolase (beta-lactamase superfamily II)
MHAADAGMVERGDMSWNRRSNKLLLRISSPLFGFGKDARFSPDALLGDGDDLATFGLPGKVIHLASHSLGSIGLLLEDGSFFCGDLFDNTKTPALNSIMDDRDAARAALAMLKAHPIQMVYPGHGQPFPFARVVKGA